MMMLPMMCILVVLGISVPGNEAQGKINYWTFFKDHCKVIDR